MIVHTFILYPVSLYAIVKISDHPNHTPQIKNFPTVELIIAAYNEEKIIGDKLDNALQLDYPEEKLNITVFSDASNDYTDDIVNLFENSRITLERIEGRVGKTECQNIVARKSDAEILVFSDADGMYGTDAIKNLIHRFHSEVGCVVGELRYRPEQSVQSESVYRVYERFIKRNEARVCSVVGGNGSIYAVRTSSYIPLPEDAISDFAEPLEIVKGGERVAYAQDAISWENTGPTVVDEKNRRERIVTRSWNSLAMNTSLLNPWKYPLFSYQLWSHTALRWLTPTYLIGMFISTIMLSAIFRQAFYQILIIPQILFLSFALLGSIVDSGQQEVPKYLQFPYYFVSLNIGLFKALIAFILGHNIKTWETIER